MIRSFLPLLCLVSFLSTQAMIQNSATKDNAKNGVIEGMRKNLEWCNGMISIMQKSGYMDLQPNAVTQDTATDVLKKQIANNVILLDRASKNFTTETQYFELRNKYSSAQKRLECMQESTAPFTTEQVQKDFTNLFERYKNGHTLMPEKLSGNLFTLNPKKIEHTNRTKSQLKNEAENQMKKITKMRLVKRSKKEEKKLDNLLSNLRQLNAEIQLP